MSHENSADRETAGGTERSEAADIETTGADAVPDKTTGTAAGGASFPEEEREGDDRADETVRDQDS